MNNDINKTLQALVPILQMNGEKVQSIEAVQDWYTINGTEYMKEVAEITYTSGYRKYADIGCDANLTAVYDVMAVLQEIKPFSKCIGRIVRGVYDFPPVEPELKELSEWKAEFKGYINALNIPKDDYDGILEYIDEVPPGQPGTTTHDSIPSETGKNDGDGTSGDCISRQQAIEAVGNMLRRKFGIGGDLAEITLACLPSVQPEMNCSEIPNNSDTISRQQAIEVLRNRWLKTRNYEGIGEDIAEECEIYLKTLPSVQPERKTGRWIEMSSTNHTYKCSVCGRLLVNITDGKNNVAKNYPYCHCGADMRGEQE